ncbi:hypothetical protein FK268_19940 [Tsukamurella sputi]|uniref:Uncharacterized protein n=1 Tax=Tsukamurella sputi TaxID=2591848 RepID=A0A5C5RHS7_9ACTN|nr:hypothetical protein [Tsukamurella sputi]TWS22280.1 hypothetical protein FK268_19940 [Tsukamurella sputi]
MQSNAITPLDEPVKYRTVRDVELALEELLPESEFSPTQLSRIAAVARERHTDRRAQVVAILDAAAQEAAAHRPVESSPAVKALDQFRSEYEPKLTVEVLGVPGAPCPWLEEDRPRWSDPDRDIHGGVVPTESRWQSEPVSVPLTMHTGSVTKEDTIALARFSVCLLQYAGERDPYVALGYIGWRPDGTASAGRSSNNLRLDEAAALARALLLLVDAAREEV